MYQPRRGQLRR